MKYTYVSQSLHAAMSQLPLMLAADFIFEDPTFFLLCLVLGVWERVSWLHSALIGTLAALEFIMQIRLASNSQGSIYLSPLNTDIRGVCHSTKDPYFQSYSIWFHLFMEKLPCFIWSLELKIIFLLLIFIVYQLYFDYYNYCSSYFIGIHIHLLLLPCPPCNLIAWLRTHCTTVCSQWMILQSLIRERPELNSDYQNSKWAIQRSTYRISVSV